MTVATFNQTDYTTQNSAEYKANIDADINVLAKLADLFAPHQSNAANMTITLDAGRLQFPGGNQANKAAQVSPVMTAPTGGNNRIDLVIIDANGDVGVLGGTPAANPSPANCTPGNIAIAQILLATGMNSILNGNITDVRGLFILGFPAIGYDSHNANTSGTDDISIGFSPSAVIFLAGMQGPNNCWSVGFDDGNNRFCLYSQYALVAGLVVPTYALAGVLQTANANNIACFISFTLTAKNSTGFSIGFNRSGVMSGNAWVGYIALR